MRTTQCSETSQRLRSARIPISDGSKGRTCGLEPCLPRNPASHCEARSILLTPGQGHVVHSLDVRARRRVRVFRHDRDRQGFRLPPVPEWISGGPDAAMEILGTVAASMVSLAALVLTITMVVVQLAMGQFSPRIVQRILQDKPSQLAIGIFVGTFAHAMLALREVQTDGAGMVPGLAVLVAFVLVVISIMVLVWYVNHIGSKLRVSALIELVGTDTRELLDTIYPDAGPSRRFERPTICAPHSGVITRIDHRALVGIAEAADCVLTLAARPGEFVPAGAPLFEIEGVAERG